MAVDGAFALWLERHRDEFAGAKWAWWSLSDGSLVLQCALAGRTGTAEYDSTKAGRIDDGDASIFDMARRAYLAAGGGKVFVGFRMYRGGFARRQRLLR